MTLAELKGRSTIIFDLFHTLSSIVHAGVGGPDTHELLGVSRETFVEALFEGSHARLVGEITEPTEIIRDIAARCRSAVPSSEYPRIAEKRRRRFAESLRRVSPGTLAALEQLRSHGKTLALISNADVLEAAGWPESPLASRFTIAVFSYDVGLAKPDPAIYEHCLRAVDAAPEDAIFVGDGGSDEFSGAAALGIPTVCTVELIRDIWPEKVAARRSQADIAVDSLAELASALST